VGKTTLSACTGQALALTGFRVLTIDNDPQPNLSYMLGANIDKPTIRDVYQAPTIGHGGAHFPGIHQKNLGSKPERRSLRPMSWRFGTLKTRICFKNVSRI